MHENPSRQVDEGQISEQPSILERVVTYLEGIILIVADCDTVKHAISTASTAIRGQAGVGGEPKESCLNS